MKRTQIQLEEQLFEALRRRAFEEQTSIAEVVRRMLQGALAEWKRRKPAKLKEFTFVGSGRSRGNGAGYIAERHDEELNRP